MRALLLLRLLTIRNGILSVVTNPKRLVFAVLFGGIIILGSALSITASILSRSSGVPLPQLPWAQAQLGALALLVLFTVSALQHALEGAVFSFPPADYDFLFAAPLPRRLVVAFRVVTDAGVTALVVALVVIALIGLVPVRVVIPHLSLTAVLTVWLAGTCYAVFIINLARILELTISTGRAYLGRFRTVVKYGLYGVLLLVLGVLLNAMTAGSAGSHALLDRMAEPPIAWLLAPMLSVAALLAGQEPPVPGGVAGALLMLVTLAMACAAGVCLLDRDVVEATIEHSARVAAVRAAARSQDLERMTGELLRLRAPAHGSFIVGWRWPDLAPVYKFLAEGRHRARRRWPLWLLVVVGPAVLAHWLPVHDAWLRVAVGPVVAYLMFGVVAPQALLHVRSEVAHVTLLRTLPGPAWRQVLAFTVPRALFEAGLIMAAIASLWLGRPIAHAQPYLAVALCVPLAVIALGLTCATVASVFPRGHDPAQRWVGGLALTVGAGLALAPGITVCALCLAWQVSPLVTGLLTNLAQLPVVLVAAALAAHFYARCEPEES